MSEELIKLSKAIEETVDMAAQSVVRVDARRRFPASGIVWSEDGIILTTHHVIEDEEDITVGLPNGEEVSATLIGRDPRTDIAILRADAQGLTVPNWAVEEEARAGQIVLALARPGENIQAVVGTLRAVGTARRSFGWPGRGDWEARFARRFAHARQRRMQMEMRFHGMHGQHFEHVHEPDRQEERFERHTEGEEAEGFGRSGERVMLPDVVMYPGFSGGALVSASGQVMGMNTSAMFRGRALTIPASTLNRVVTTLIEHGRVRQGFLGIGAQPARLPDSIAAELDQDTGLLIVSVEEGSPAQQAELLVGDIIVAFDGEPTYTLEDLLGMLSGERVGRAVPVQIVRGGELSERSVTIGERL